MEEKRAAFKDTGLKENKVDDKKGTQYSRKAGKMPGTSLQFLPAQCYTGV